MKEQKDSSSKKTSPLEAARRRRRESRASVSSKRSVVSNESEASGRSRGFGRPRGMSFMSTYSNAVSDGSNGSVETNASSRKTSHADDSDASNSNSSLGETDQDVWFPNDAQGNGDINVEELDQSSNLSDDSSSPHASRRSVHRRNSAATYGGSQYAGSHYGGSHYAAPPGPPPAINADEEFDADHEDVAEINEINEPISPRTSPHVQYAAASADARKSASSSSSRPENFRPTPIAASGSDGKQFVQYEPRIASSPKRFSTSEFSHRGSVHEHRGSMHEHRGEHRNSTSGDAVPPQESPSTGSSDNVDTEKKGCDETVTTTRIGEHIGSPRSKAEGAGLGEVTNGEQQSQRFSFYATGLDNTIHAPDLASLVGESDSFSTSSNPANGAWFLDCFRPTDVEMKASSRAFGIHPLTTEDISTGDAREKYEQFKNYYLVVYHTFENDKEDPKYMETINFYVLVFKEGVISFHFEPVSHCRNVRRRMRQSRDYVDITPDWIAYASIDDITDSFAPEIMAVEKEADFVEEAVYLDENAEIEMHESSRRLGEGRKLTMHSSRMLGGKSDVVRGFAKRCNEQHSMPASEMSLYLGDILDHISTMSQNSNSYEKIFSKTHFNYMGLSQMEFVDSSNRMTAVLGKITMSGSILLPMNLITGSFGMNVDVPGQGVPNSRWFFGILALIVFMSSLSLGSGVSYINSSLRKKHERSKAQ